MGVVEMFRLGVCTREVISRRYATTIQIASYCSESRHADKIKKTKGVKFTQTPRKSMFAERPKKRPAAAPRLHLEMHSPARRPDQIVPIEEDSDLSNPEIMRQVEEIEREHYRKYGITPPGQEDALIGEGQRNIDEEEQELLEQINTEEPAFNINKYAKDLARVRNYKDLCELQLGFTCDEFVKMLEDQHVEKIRVIDARRKSTELDFLIIGTLHSDRHRRATANYVYMQAKKRYQLANEYGSLYVKQYLLATPEEKPEVTRDSDEWVCVHCGDVQVHLFSPETRREYNLERLWTKEIKDLDPDRDLRELEKHHDLLMSNDKRAMKRSLGGVDYDSDYRDLMDTSSGEDTDSD